jgi:exodeoxyribonuclease III
MKIITWNVNGLRAAMKKGAWEWLRAQGADVICLQEIKVRPEQLTEEQHRSFAPYLVVWNPAGKPGYSGVASFLRDPAPETAIGTGNPDFDGEGRVIITRHPGFLLFNTYFPSGQRGHERVAYKLNFYAHLLEICDRLHAAGEKIVICGDFNTAHREIDLRYPKQNQKTSGFLPEERAWVRHLSHPRFQGRLPGNLPGPGFIHLVDVPAQRPPAGYRLALGLFPGFRGAAACRQRRTGSPGGAGLGPLPRIARSGRSCWNKQAGEAGGQAPVTSGPCSSSASSSSGWLTGRWQMKLRQT